MTPIKKRIYVIRFSTQYKLTATFLRFSEFYESMYFRAKIFTLEEYADWYAETYRKFSYYEDWSGFNINSRVIKIFREGKFDPLSKKEKGLLRLLRNAQGNFHVIGVSKKHKSALKHELIHSLFYLYPKYSKLVLECIRANLTKTKKMVRWLNEAGYDYTFERAFLDEVNAYTLSESENDSTINNALRKKLTRIFVDYFGFDITNSMKTIVNCQFYQKIVQEICFEGVGNE